MKVKKAVSGGGPTVTDGNQSWVKERRVGTLPYCSWRETLMYNTMAFISVRLTACVESRSVTQGEDVLTVRFFGQQYHEAIHQPVSDL